MANNIIRLVAWLNLSLSLLCAGVIRIPGQLRTNTHGPCSHVQHERPAFTLQQAYRSFRLRRAIACWFRIGSRCSGIRHIRSAAGAQSDARSQLRLLPQPCAQDRRFEARHGRSERCRRRSTETLIYSANGYNTVHYCPVKNVNR